MTDTVNLTYTGNTWDVLLPVTSFVLGMGENSMIDVYVTVPSGAANGEMDILELTAISSGNPFSTASSVLTSTATWHRTLLPLALKN